MLPELAPWNADAGKYREVTYGLCWARSTCVLYGLACFYAWVYQMEICLGSGASLGITVQCDVAWPCNL